MNKHIKQRQAILELLYQAGVVEKKYHQAYIPISDITDALGNSDFNLGVLEELNQIRRDGYKVRITGKGVMASETANS